MTTLDLNALLAGVAPKPPVETADPTLMTQSELSAVEEDILKHQRGEGPAVDAERLKRALATIRSMSGRRASASPTAKKASIPLDLTTLFKPKSA